MLEWIVENKEWLFSGVGVALIGWFFFRSKSDTNITASNRSVSAENIENTRINIGDNNEQNK